jgi:hypothetical protein
MEAAEAEEFANTILHRVAALRQLKQEKASG